MNTKYISQLTKHYGHSGEHKKFVEEHYKANMTQEWNEYFKEEFKYSLDLYKKRENEFNKIREENG